MPRPNVNTSCVADRYAGTDERIVEVTGQNGTGCLISIQNAADGTVSMHVYRRDRALVVTVAEAD